MYDRKEYDRLRAKRLYEDFKQRREALMLKFGDACYLCEQKARKGFNLHHIIYDSVESNYPRHSKSMSVRLKRLKEAEEHPERFRLLCPSCHHFITKLHFNVNINKLMELLKC